MDLYHSVMDEVKRELLSCEDRRHYAYRPEKCWNETERFELVMKRDEAFELGGDGHDSVNFMCVTSTHCPDATDEITLIGPDLKQIKDGAPYARIVLLEVEPMPGESESEMDKQSSEKLFRAIQKLDFIKYHVFPEGFMIRTSSESFKEQVRISRKALDKGMSFEKIGNTFLRHYKEAPGVKHAKVIFITDEQINFELLKSNAKKVHDITLALSKILEGMATDCSVCSLKAVCDEVEGMRELHFKST